MGQSPPSSTYNKEGIGLPFLQGKMEFGDIYPKAFVYCSEPIKIAQHNDILFSVRAPVGDVNLVQCKLCIGRGLAAIRFNGKLADYLFYFYYFQKIKKSLEALGKGSTFKAINKDDLESLIIPLPPLNEQRAVAGVLGVVDSVIAKTDEVIAKTERLKKGLMQTLLTRGIGHKEFKDTEIGKIPKEWGIVRLGDVAEIWDKYRIPIKEQDRKPGPFPYCGANGIIDYVDGYTHDGEFVLLAEDGGFFGPFENSAYIMRGKFWANNHVHILKAIEGVLINKFLMFYLNFMNLVPFFTGSTRPKLTQDDMKRIPLPLPSLSEQQKIAEILSTIDKKLKIERQEKARLEKIKQGLMDLLLTGKIRVKV